LTLEQGLVYAVIGLTLVMLALEIWRYDLVALVGMLLLVALGTISVEEALAGFGHSAIITIAAVLVVSRGLQNTGVADLFVRWMSVAGDRLAPQLIVLCALVVLSSAFMNNIAALAIFIPVAVRIARKSDRAASLYLLPMAFSSHFGGLITLIGTPTNLIVSTLRVEHGGERFGMFAFAPVGVALSIVGVVFIALVGWHLIPKRKGGTSMQEGVEDADFVTEVEVPSESELAGQRLRDLKSTTDADLWVVAIMRDDERISSPEGYEKILAGDTLLVRAEADALRQFAYDADVEFTESQPLEEGNGNGGGSANAWEQLKASLQTDDVEIVEVIVSIDSMTIGKTPKDLNLRARYGVNLLAISRADEHLRSSLGTTSLEAGDVLMVQLHHEEMAEIFQTLGFILLEEQEIHLQPRNTALGLTIFVIALLTASLEILPVPIAMVAAAVAMTITGLLSLREAYRSIEWPIIVLLGAMLSMGAALEGTGGDHLIAEQILRTSDFLSPPVLLIVVLLVTMMLSDIVNNTASVVLMGSIAISVARGLGVSSDPFLVAIAVGGACAFLTPIGHEANVLVFEVGGYEFGDYWRLGLPLELLITAVTVPILLWLWPL
jgi:di/tricarboxylate transporter